MKHFNFIILKTNLIFIFALLLFSCSSGPGSYGIDSFAVAIKEALKNDAVKKAAKEAVKEVAEEKVKETVEEKAKEVVVEKAQETINEALENSEEQI